jgi:hypothetical protein
MSVEEGEFENGMKNGYCRVINPCLGIVECGFFMNDQPNGKFVRWSNDEELLDEGMM